ncbi:MAG: hypothetical protein V4583_17800 [Pseudomonadota bacterium]|uniref:hypothetical protein n=1 Tax=Tabrizicola sp. TaxID=2005166 RepID=UPI0025D88649|nr:hypothetical protein [Tabrizicola sp.]
MPVSRRLVVLGLGLALAGCGGLRDSRLNPFNWFRRSEPRETIVLPGEEADTRPLVDTVLSMAVEPIPGGAVVRARGVTPTQGWWEAELVARDVGDDGVLVYEFRLLPPKGRTDVNTQRSREIDVAIYISDIKLQSVREIVVQGASNARSAQR